MDELREFLAERSHIRWMAEKQRQGFAPHSLTVCADSFWPGQCGYPDDKHHTDMLPYADLAENVKQYDREMVQGVLDGIEAAGYAVIPTGKLSRLQEAVALLNSMVLCGEQHSEKSRAAVHAAITD